MTRPCAVSSVHRQEFQKTSIMHHLLYDIRLFHSPISLRSKRNSLNHTNVNTYPLPPLPPISTVHHSPTGPHGSLGPNQHQYPWLLCSSQPSGSATPTSPSAPSPASDSPGVWNAISSGRAPARASTRAEAAGSGGKKSVRRPYGGGLARARYGCWDNAEKVLGAVSIEAGGWRAAAVDSDE